MKRYVFVGEERSQRAITMNVTWKDGKLAAKQLFDALKANNIDPANQAFDNWFEGEDSALRIKVFQAYGYIVVAMGEKVSMAMAKAGISHLRIVHPAARGKIRKKEIYAKHIKETLAHQESPA